MRTFLQRGSIALFDKDTLVTLLTQPLLEHTFSIQRIGFLPSGSR